MERDKVRQRLEKRLAKTRPGTGHHRVLTRRLEKLLDQDPVVSEKAEEVSEKVREEEPKAETSGSSKEKKTKRTTK